MAEQTELVPQNPTPHPSPEELLDTVQAVVDRELRVDGLIATIAIIVTVIIIRLVLIRFIRGQSEFLSESQRRWLNRANNMATIIMLCGIVFVWAPQIQSLALSLTAVAVAIVLCTKELILCVTGGIFRATTKPFKVGDWITVGSVTGEVLEITAMSTRIEEIDRQSKSYAFTGRSISLPNSIFFTTNVENSNFTKAYIFHEFAISVAPADRDPSVLMQMLMQIIESELESSQNEAGKFLEVVERKTNINFPDPTPRVHIRTTDNGNIQFMVQILVRTQEALKTSSVITRKFLSYVAKETDDRDRASVKQSPEIKE